MQHQRHIQRIIQSNTEEEEGKGKEEKGREAVLYGVPQIEREQVGVGLAIILFGYLFAGYIGVISASISILVWILGNAIVSTFNAVQITSYFTIIEDGLGVGFRGGFANGVAAFLSSTLD